MGKSKEIFNQMREQYKVETHEESAERELKEFEEWKKEIKEEETKRNVLLYSYLNKTKK